MYKFKLKYMHLHTCLTFLFKPRAKNEATQAVSDTLTHAGMGSDLEQTVDIFFGWVDNMVHRLLI